MKYFLYVFFVGNMLLFVLHELILLLKLTFFQPTMQVVVSTKSPKSDKQYVWEALADSSSYVIKEETDPEEMLTRGTQITLFLRVCLCCYVHLMS